MYSSRIEPLGTLGDLPIFRVCQTSAVRGYVLAQVLRQPHLVEKACTGSELPAKVCPTHSRIAWDQQTAFDKRPWSPPLQVKCLNFLLDIRRDPVITNCSVVNHAVMPSREVSER